MKPFEKLTDADLTALTDQDIERYVDLACAEQGIQLKPEFPPEPPAMGNFEPDAMVYKAPQYLEFTDEAEAREVVRVVSQCKSRVQTGYTRTPEGVTGEHIRTRDVGEARVEAKRVFSAERAAAMGEEMAQAAVLEEAYKKRLKEYQSIVSSHANVRAEIMAPIYLARERSKRSAELQRVYERYLLLAEGSERIALGFLAKGYSDARERLPQLPWSLIDPAGPPALIEEAETEATPEELKGAEEIPW